YCSEEDLVSLRDEHRIVLQYCDAGGEVGPESNPNGALENIAAVINQKGNVMGLMPHPERASREILGSVDGLTILENFVRATQ
ncbi:MAG: phosphoribosylformylglycinamidine synthase I, partial [Candidatus Thorarchaeota archaeon]